MNPSAQRPGSAGEPPRDCPACPNCVSSTASDPARRVEPITVGGNFDIVWERVRAAVSALPRTRIVHDDGEHLHAECRSRLLGLADDLEIALRADGRTLDVRCAARVGYWDLGVNRRRVLCLRRRLELDD